MSRSLWRQIPGAADELQAKQARRLQRKDFAKANFCEELYDHRKAYTTIFE